VEEVFTERAKEIVLQAVYTPLDGYTASNGVKVRYTTSEENSADTLRRERENYSYGGSHMSRKSVVILNRTVKIT
jgi:hypothetical protein